MSLAAVRIQLCEEFDQLLIHLRGFTTRRRVISSASHFSLEDECLLEGLLSRVWQSWSAFCRSTVCESCLGTTNAFGSVVVAHPKAASEAHVSGASIRAKSTATAPTWGTSNSVLRHEPTWGDVDVLSKVISRLGPSNQSQLLAAFSGGSQSAKALQTIRNATAHNNNQTMTAVNGIRSRYVTFPVTHPVQALYWIDRSSQNFLVTHSVEELRDASLAAIS
jgi:hypothetical protein